MPLSEKQFYCVYCNEKRTEKSHDICVKLYKNRKSISGKIPTLKSKCHVCGTNLIKFIKHNSTDAMIKKYGRC